MLELRRVRQCLNVNWKCVYVGDGSRMQFSPGCVCECVCLIGLAGKAIPAPVNGLQGDAPLQESGTLSDECSLFLYDGGLAGKQGSSQTGVSVQKY